MQSLELVYKCMICHEKFDDNNCYPYIFITCGHSICKKCSLEYKKCPICKIKSILKKNQILKKFQDENFLLCLNCFYPVHNFFDEKKHFICFYCEKKICDKNLALKNAIEEKKNYLEKSSDFSYFYLKSFDYTDLTKKNLYKDFLIPKKELDVILEKVEKDNNFFKNLFKNLQNFKKNYNSYNRLKDRFFEDIEKLKKNLDLITLIFSDHKKNTKNINESFSEINIRAQRFSNLEKSEIARFFISFLDLIKCLKFSEIENSKKMSKFSNFLKMNRKNFLELFNPIVIFVKLHFSIFLEIEQNLIFVENCYEDFKEKLGDYFFVKKFKGISEAYRAMFLGLKEVFKLALRSDFSFNYEKNPFYF